MKWRSPSFLSVVMVAVIMLLSLGYLFLPILPLTFPPQDQFRNNPDIRMALHSIAEVWGVSEEHLYVFATHIDAYNSKSIVIIDPENLSSAEVWIPAPDVKHNHSTTIFNSPSNDLHLLNQYIPQSPLERAIAQNFYTRGGRILSHKAVVRHIEPGIPLGELRVNSLTTGEVLIPVLLTYPLPFSIHIDY